MFDSIWISAVFQGIALGFGLAFLIGPAFFALLQASIEQGFAVSVALALGVVCSDCVLMAASYSLLQELESIPWFHEILGLVGGVVLIVTGIQTMRQRDTEIKELKIRLKDVWPLFRKGFSINTFNPFPWMFWLSTSAMVSQGIGKQGTGPATAFFVAAALTVFATDTAKAWAAQFLLKFLKPQILARFRFVSGLGLGGFGIRLLWFAWKGFTR